MEKADKIYTAKWDTVKQEYIPQTETKKELKMENTENTQNTENQEVMSKGETTFEVVKLILSIVAIGYAISILM